MLLHHSASSPRFQIIALEEPQKFKERLTTENSTLKNEIEGLRIQKEWLRRRS